MRLCHRCQDKPRPLGIPNTTGLEGSTVSPLKACGGLTVTTEQLSKG